jgi:cell division protein FtsL
MAKRRVARSRRTSVAFMLLGFVLVATGVIARRSYGINQARKLRDLTRQRSALESERLRLEAAIRDASSRARLAPIAEQRLNMHVPSPDQVINLPRPANAGRVSDSTSRRP